MLVVQTFFISFYRALSQVRLWRAIERAISIASENERHRRSK